MIIPPNTKIFMNLYYLHLYLRQGLTLQQIAKRFNIHREVLRLRLIAFLGGVSCFRNYNEIQKARALEKAKLAKKLYESGISLGMICRKLHSHPTTLTKYLRQLGVSLRSHSEAMKNAINRKFPMGHKRTDSQGGYVWIKCQHGYTLEHTAVWENYHKQKVPHGWHIHHLNGIKNDNRPENLKALPHREHSRITATNTAKIRSRIKQLEDEIIFRNTLHPDHGGSNELMAQLNKAYEDTNEK